MLKTDPYTFYVNKWDMPMAKEVNMKYIKTVLSGMSITWSKWLLYFYMETAKSFIYQ